MKVERVRCGAFGSLNDFDTGSDALPGLVVVVGPNEAGKSTFFEVLVSLLYGFRPTSREIHPFAPRTGGEIDIEACLTLDGGQAWHVHRRLLAAPRGHLDRNGDQEDLKNRPLPAITHVDRQVFRHVYAITLAELAALETETWNQIQDRLIGAMGARDLVPLRKAVESLEQDAGALWRPTRHGNQRIREVDARVLENLSRRQDALDRDLELRRLTHEAATATTDLKAARERREHRRLALENARRLQPIRSHVKRVQELEKRGGPPEDLDGLPSAPGERLAESRRACEELEARLATLKQDRIPPQALVDAYGEVHRGIVGMRDDVTRVVAAATAMEAEWLRLGALEQEIQDLERRRQPLARELMTVPASQLDAERLRGLRTAELRDRIRAFGRAREEREHLQARIAASARSRQSSTALAGVVVGLVGGLGLVAWGSFSDQGTLVVAGAALVSAALGVAGHWWWMRRTGRRAATGKREGGPSTDAEHREREALDAIQTLLADLPMHEEILRDPTTDVASSLVRLQELTGDLTARQESIDEIRSRMTALQVEARELGGRLGVVLPPDSTGAGQALSRALREADDSRRDAEAGEGELERLDRERLRWTADLEDARQRLGALEGSLRKLSGGDLAAGLKEAEIRIDARNRATQAMDELRRTHPDLDDVLVRIRQAEESGEDWTLDSDALVEAATELEELTHRIEELGKHLVALEHEVADLERQPTIDQVDGEGVALQEELDWLRRTRDRKVLLARILREADRVFREEHQPDVLRRAGDYLEHITGGRYVRLSGGEADMGAEFQLHGPDLAEPMTVDETTSTGTREQVYLALRLAIVDHLDRDQERLPLLLDEVFVNWDEARRTRGLDLVVEVARTRQVFLCTCHEEWAAELKTRGARLVHL
ncbi:MAG: hypothetical protein BMS9Abin29_0424 [Gemmatimonadota bacterium]|nr:MAG: hypothetical protein BMS9Abin29_0424 [Gemmatimonadota bacterium]